MLPELQGRWASAGLRLGAPDLRAERVDETLLYLSCRLQRCWLAVYPCSAASLGEDQGRIVSVRGVVCEGSLPGVGREVSSVWED
jgi:hypothetical protein